MAYPRVGSVAPYRVRIPLFSCGWPLVTPLGGAGRGAIAAPPNKDNNTPTPTPRPPAPPNATRYACPSDGRLESGSPLYRTSAEVAPSRCRCLYRGRHDVVQKGLRVHTIGVGTGYGMYHAS